MTCESRSSRPSASRSTLCSEWPIMHPRTSQKTRTFLDALQRRADGDKSVVDNPKIEDAVNNVNRRAARGCNLFKREPGSGI